MTETKDNPYIKRLSKENHGRRSEKNFAKDIKGRVQPGSGNMVGAKGDVRVKAWLVECKATADNSIKVSRTWLTKIKFEARDAGKLPALSLRFVTEDGTVQDYGSWVCIEESEFNALVNSGE